MFVSFPIFGWLYTELFKENWPMNISTFVVIFFVISFVTIIVYYFIMSVVIIQMAIPVKLSTLWTDFRGRYR